MTPHDPEEFTGSAAEDPSLVAFGLLRGRTGKIVKIVSSFLLGQGAIQLLNTGAAFFLVHRLSVEAYAQFGLTTGFQAVFAILMDLGLATTIIPLIGDRRDDPDAVGRYIRAAKHLRDRCFLYLSPVASVSFFAIVHRHHWSVQAQVALLASVLLSLFSSGAVSYFSTPLFMFARLREYYTPQVISACVRLLALFLLSVFGGLTASTASLITALAITCNAIFLRRKSARFFRWPGRTDPAAVKEMLKYIYPAVPVILFSAFQSQIALFLVSIFGGSLNTAEVTALGRIGILFAAMLTFVSTVIEPYLARQGHARLGRLFLGFGLLASVVCIPIIWAGFAAPGVFVALLGHKYEGVRQSIGWYILGQSMNFVAGVMWVMNRARKWVFWSGSILEIVVLLAAQTAFLILVGVRNTQEAVMFNLASGCCYLVAHFYVTALGFWSERKQPGSPAMEASN